MTPEQIQKLNTAIHNAKNPGACRYLEDDEPSCVIAQLATLEGVTKRQLKGWLRKQICNVMNEGNPGSARLTDYDVDLLQDLQDSWDDSQIPDDDRIGHLLNIVDSWVTCA